VPDWPDRAPEAAGQRLDISATGRADRFLLGRVGNVAIAKFSWLRMTAE